MPSGRRRARCGRARPRSRRRAAHSRVHGGRTLSQGALGSSGKRPCGGVALLGSHIRVDGGQTMTVVEELPTHPERAGHLTARVATAAAAPTMPAHSLMRVSSGLRGCSADGSGSVLGLAADPSEGRARRSRGEVGFHCGRDGGISAPKLVIRRRKAVGPRNLLLRAVRRRCLFRAPRGGRRAGRTARSAPDSPGSPALRASLRGRASGV